MSWRAKAAVVVTGASVVALAAWLWSAWMDERLHAWKRDASPLLFFTAMALLPMVGVPLTPLLVLAGATFGVATALVGSTAALAVNLALSFWVARGRLRPALEWLLRRSRYSLPDMGTSKRAWRFTAMMKLAPGLPMFVKHYVIALASVPFATYFAVSFVVSGAYAATLIVLGDSAIRHARENVVGTSIVLVTVAILLLGWRNRQAAT